MNGWAEKGHNERSLWFQVAEEMPCRCSQDLYWVAKPDHLLNPPSHICCVLFHSSQPGVTHQGGQVWSFSRIFPEADINKVPHFIAEDTTRQSRGRLVHNVFQKLEDGHRFVHPLRCVRCSRRPRRRHQVLRVFQKGRSKAVSQMGWIWWWNRVAAKRHLQQ